MSEHDYFVEFARELGALNGNITAVLKRLEKGDEKMADHEARLAMLESHDRPQGDGDADWRRVAFALLKYGGWVLAILIWLLGVKLPG